ncbi:hypothetical protein WK94_24355 [Burkholderia ubonensis]|uniref:hypothetical protein n=1 Tax=Burkholderia ubonensis TaxID=101571 RepID=UPI000759D17C|nr:hypothetical protein [Burkholderia ubonensis]KVW39466.1 hypothetical protein WK94_24355 [Burkholderia ubonensis]
MKLSDILHDALGVIELLKPHVRDDGDQYHAQLANSLTAAHGAALEAEQTAAEPVADPVLTAIAALGTTIEQLVPSTAPVLEAIEALGSHLSDLTATVHDVRAALTAPATSATQAPAA